jgi:PAS domain S-box-containing protein
MSILNSMYPGTGNCFSGRRSNRLIPATIRCGLLSFVISLIAVNTTFAASPFIAVVDAGSSLLTVSHIVWAIVVVLVATGSGLIWAEALTRSRKNLEDQITQRNAALEKENYERRQVEADLREAQALYLSLAENFPGSVYRKDIEGRYVYVNAAFCRMKDRAEKDILGKTIFDLLPPDRAAEASREDEAIIRTGKPLQIEKADPTSDGEFRYVYVFKASVLDAAGKVVGTQGVITDLTARRLVEAQMDSERDLLRFLLDNSQDHIYFKDRESRFIKCSRKQAERFGQMRPDDVIGKTDFDFFDGEHAYPAFHDEQEIVRTGQSMLGKFEKEVSKDGRVTWALTTKMPLRNKTGEIIGTFGISKDVTAIKESEAKLEQVHRQLLETSRMAGMAEVATSVLHNVGNVLNSVNVSSAVIADKVRQSKVVNLGKAVVLMQEHEKNLAEFLTEDTKGKQVVSYLQTLSQHLAKEQGEMVKELASLSKNIDHIKEIVAMQQSYSKVSGVCEIVAPVDLVEDALRMNGAALDRHEIELVRDYAKTPTILVEKHKVLQILVNLIRNAKYACDESGHSDKTLTVKIGLSASGVAISVLDNGIGIPAENLARIFNHGFTTRRNGHGFGLHSGALAAKELGGSLTMHSEGAGKGAAFTLELPLQPPKTAPVKPAASTVASDSSPMLNGKGHTAIVSK